MKPHPEYIEGPEAFELFQAALKNCVRSKDRTSTQPVQTPHQKEKASRP